MRKNIGKRALVIVLATALMSNSLQLPGSTMQVSAAEVKFEDNEETNLHETEENDTLSELLRIGQTKDMDNVPNLNASDCTYDTPIILTSASEVRLFAGWGIADEGNENTENDSAKWQYSYIVADGNTEKSEIAKCPYEGKLTWSILRGESGSKPGTTNLVNDEDDWKDFETVTSAPFFIMEEDEDENSPFFKMLTITGNDLEDNDNYDYYIRATFRYIKDQEECIATTTVPITVTITEEEKKTVTIAEDEETLVTDEDEETITIEDEEKTLVADEAEESITTMDEDEEETLAIEENEETITTEPEQSEETLTDEESEILETDEEPATDAEAETTSAKEQESLSTLEGENIEEDIEEDAETDFQTDSDKSATTEIGISKLTLNKTSATMNPGDTWKPTVTIVPEGLNLSINWSSSNSDIATVDENGTIMAVSEGNAEITAECGGKTACITIDVIKTDAEKNNDQPQDEEGNMIAISDEIWIAGFERESGTLTYNGSKITQNLRIYHKGTLLKEKTDYVLTYKNNINAAAYNSLKAPSVTVTMKGQYTGSQTLYFTIAPRDIDEYASKGYEQVINYSKKLKISAPVIYYGSKKLVYNKDFVCDYSSLPENYTKGDSYETGTSYEYTVNGIGNFTGSFNMSLVVVKDKNFDFGNATVTLDKKQYEYHGEALSASDVGIISVNLGKKNLDTSLYEYKVYAEAVGTGYVEIYPSEAGRSDGYRGIKKLNIKVVGDRNIKNVELGTGWQDTITFSQKILENGGICQEKSGVLLFTDGDSRESLTEGVDYTTKYSNNKKVGMATITFTGMGRYTGSFKKTYKIIPNTDLYIKWHNTDDTGMPVVSYVKNGAIPQFDLLEASESENSYVLNSKTDYTVKVSNNKKLGIMTCEITGKGNYKGYSSRTEVKVISGDISQGTITVNDKQYSNRANAWKSAVTITDVNGKKLKAGTDYSKELIYNYDGMEDGLLPQAGTVVYVTALGINNYEGSCITGSYRIYSTNLSKLTVKIDAQEYTGKDIELSADDIHVYATKNDAKKGIEIIEPCYEIVKYSNNIKAGTAKVTLRGIGSYGGTKTYSFKITKKKYLTTRVTGIALDETSLALGVGNSKQLTATITPEDAYNKTVIWTTSNSKIATVNEEGIITANGSGTVTIKATAQDTGKKVSCKVKVSVIPVTSFILNTEEINQYEGTEFQLKATEIQPVQATYSTIEWESTNPEVASVDANGKVSLNKAGMAVIKAYANERQFVRKCLVFVNSKEETEPDGTYLTPQMFRTGDEDDDTESFNDAIQNISEACNTVYVPAGTYKIDALTGIQLKSNMNFVMSPNAVLLAIGNSSKHYNVIHVNNVDNVTISGGTIKGERYGHTGTSGEWGMGIGLYDSTNISITDITISECWGDGIYIGSKHEEDSDAGCNQVTITNCKLYNNRRNNMSIVSADYIMVDNCKFYDANGTAPEYGIDIETNNLNNPCEHITISNSIFSGNGQAAIGIITAADDVNISGCTLYGNFINYSGTNVTISDSTINGKMYARVGVSMVDGTKINDGGSGEDTLIASFRADEGPYTIDECGIDDSNLMSYSMIDDSDSPSGKALYLKRESKGTKEAGYYLNLSELTEGEASILENGSTYRFEYVVKGTGQWGIKTSQTAWYPCAPMSDKFSTGVTTYKAGSGKSCKVMIYAVDTTKDMYIEIESIKIYKVN